MSNDSDRFEAALLGAIVLQPFRMAEVAGIVDVSDFGTPAYRMVFAAAKALAWRGVPVEPLELEDELQRREQLDTVRQAVDVTRLGELCPMADSALSYAKHVREAAQRRTARSAAHELQAAIERGDELDVALAAHRRALEQVARSTGAKHWQVAPAEWFSSTPPPVDWLLTDWGGDGYLPRSKVCLLSSPGGTGKSFALAALTLAVAAGNREWLSLQTPGEPGRVALLVGEEDAPELQRRLYRVAKQMKLEPKAVAERVLVAPLAGVDCRLADEEGATTPFYAEIRAALEKHGELSLVIADPFARFAAPGAEADNALATRMIAILETFTELPGKPAVIAAHHTNKMSRRDKESAAEATRGVSGLVDGARTVLSLSMEQVESNTSLGSAAYSIGTLELVKTNYAAPRPPIVVIRRKGEYGALAAATEDERKMKDAYEAKKAKDKAAAQRAQRTTGKNQSSGRANEAPDDVG